MRLMVWTHELVCSVANARWPVSAMVSAASIGLEVAHLADQHDVGILAQDVLERVLEALGVGADLALVDDAVLVRVQVLDRILDRHDVVVALAVDRDR